MIDGRRLSEEMDFVNMEASRGICVLTIFRLLIVPKCSTICLSYGLTIGKRAMMMDDIRLTAMTNAAG
jgi:hypothetical protein